MAKKLRAASKNGTASDESASPPSPPSTDGAPPAKKRGRPKISVEAMGNVSDATIQEKISDVVSKRAALTTAQGHYRAAIKACRMVGLEPADVSWYIATRARDTRDVDAETRRRTRLAAVMGLPIGSQLGLFDDGTSAATKSERTFATEQQAMASTERSIAAAKDLGRKHGKEGLTRVDEYKDGSPEQLAYDAAWNEAQRDLMQAGFGPTAAAGSA